MRLVLRAEVLHNDPRDDVAHIICIGQLGERHARHQALFKHTC